MPEILRKLRSNAPDWYAKYIEAYTEHHTQHLESMLSCPTDMLPRQQGVCAEQSHHLRILKSAL